MNDVQEHYCGHCHVFHDNLWPPARRWWIKHAKDFTGNPGHVPGLVDRLEQARENLRRNF
jgi:hypothetical protein